MQLGNKNKICSKKGDLANFNYSALHTRVMKFNPSIQIED
jgi:hypothetical protein